VLALVALAVAQEPPPAEAPPADAPADDLPLVKAPELLEFVQAPYPPEAESQGITGTVKLAIEIDTTGAVTHVDVLAPAGHGFDEAAVAAASAFRFSPAEDPNGPIAVVIEFDYGFVQAPVPVEPPVVLTGTLREMATRITLANVAVQVRQGETLVTSAVTDADGHFSLRGLAPGDYEIVAFDVEHGQQTAKVKITEGEVTDVGLWLRRITYTTPGIVGIYEKERPPEVTRRTLSIEEVRRVPGTFGDPVRVIQSLPGAARAPFSLGLLVLRGANPDDSNVYIDGVEVPLVYHLGGFRSILNPALIESVDYLPGTYSSYYGRSTGGVVDVRTKSTYPEVPQIDLRTDVLDTGLYATGRIKNKIGFAAGIRRSYIDVLLGAILADQGFYAAPRWFDYQLKLQGLDTGEDELSAFLFGFQDDLIVRTDANADDQVGLHYSTHRLVLRWAHPIDEHLSLDLQPTLGIDGTRFGFGQEIGLEVDAEYLLLRGNLTWRPNDAVTARFGLDSQGSRTDYAIFVQSVPVDGDDPNSEEEPVEFGDGLWQLFPDPYAELTLRPLQDRERLVLVGGARLAAAFTEDETPAFAGDPRLGARIGVLPGGTLKLGSGIYHQQDLGASTFERAISSEVGWEQQFTPAISADVTGFYRWMDHLGSGFGDEGDGVGRAYGMEVMLRHALANRFFGWISYTLSKSERRDSPDSGDWYPFDFDQTHILTAVAGYRLPYDFELGARAQYVTGNPYTPYDGGIYLMDEGSYFAFPSGDTNSERMAPFYAVDLRVEKLFTFKAWQLSIFADVLNAVHGENPEFILYNYDYTESRYINGLPLIPSLGFEAKVNL
jgi:TonB family protein